MITKKKKNRNKNTRHFKFFSILFVFLFLLIIGFLIFSNINITQKRVGLIKRIEELRKEVRVLETENQRLQDEIIRAGGKDFLEEKAREELGLKKPGEEVVIISPLQEEVEKPIEKEKGLWQRIWKRLGF